MADKENRDVRDADEVVREYYENGETDEERNDVLDEFRDAQEIPHAVMKRAVQAERREDITPRGRDRSGDSNLGYIESGGDIDARDGGGGEETVGGSHALPDQDDVEEIGKAAGLTYEDSEPLRADEKVAERDADRWELNPVSSEDYQERVEAQRESPAAEHGRATREAPDTASDKPRKRRRVSRRR